MRNIDLIRPAVCRGSGSARSYFGAAGFRALLLLGVAGVAVSGAGPAQADGLVLNWTGAGTGDGGGTAWGQADNWANAEDGSFAVPSFSDTANITMGTVKVGTKNKGAGYVDMSGGVMTIVANKNFRATTQMTVRDTAIVDVFGQLIVFAEGDMPYAILLVQDGGQLNIKPLTDGATGTVIVDELQVDGGVVDVGGGLYGAALVMKSGTIKGDGYLRTDGATQTGGSIEGVDFDVSYFNYFGGSFSGNATVRSSFVLGDNYGQAPDTVVVAAGTVITGGIPYDPDAEVDPDAVVDPITFGQSGNTQMSGTVSGFDVYTQTGGLMDGSVSAGQYMLGGTGTASGTVDFATNFQLADDAVVTADAVLVGAEGSTMEQLSGTMNGTVGGIDSYLQWDGTMAGSVSTGTYTAYDGTISGAVEFSQGFDLQGDAKVTSTTRLFQTGGSMGSLLDEIDVYKQSGGSIDGEFSTRTFELADGEALGVENVNITNELIQSGGTLNVVSREVPIFTQSGGSFSGTISVEDYNLTGAGATAEGEITASHTITLGPDSGTVDFWARLDGAADLVKTGDSRVILRSSFNAFTGTVTVSGGVLEAINDALPDAATVSVAEGATLQFSINQTKHVTFAGTITGDTGTLVKAGKGILTLSGNIELGALAVDFGTLNIGDGTTTETASFDSAVIAAKSTLYVAKNATLEIRVPNNLTNYGTLINDGTVIDDLDNASMFNNNGIYKANVASNTGTINNNTPGVWTGNVLSNAGTINNNSGSTWTGDVKASAGTISNAAGATWTGSVASTGAVGNRGHWSGAVVSNTFGNIDNVGADAIWTGDVLASNSRISNYEGAHWIGDVVNNTNVIYNKSTWTGDIDGNGSSSNHDGIIQNYGTWTGDIKRNFGGLVVIDGGWTGDIVDNAGWIVNNGNDLIENLHGVNATTWDGDVTNGSGTISNDYSGIWKGDVLDNRGPAISGGRIENYGAWDGDVFANHGTIMNIAGSWSGDIISNNGRLINNWNNNSSNVGGVNHAIWEGDVSTFEAVINDTGGIWKGRVLGNNNAVYNYVGAEWTGNVVANGGGSNVHAQIGNFGAWDGDVEGNAGGIYTGNGSWDGDILANAGWIYNNMNDDTDNPDGVNATVWTGNVTNTTGRVVNDHFGTWKGDVLANGGTITNRSDAEWMGNVLANAGTLVTTGLWIGNITSSGRLEAGNSITGAVSNTGVLALSGDLSVGSVSFGNASYLDIDLGSGGAGEALTVFGLATVDGTVHVKGGSGMTSGDFETPYVFLTAGSLSGVFSGVTTDMAFLTPTLAHDYTQHTVSVTLQRSSEEFSAVGVTDNQKAVAGEVDDYLGEGNALYDSIIWLTAEEAQAAFDQLSGEVYATAQAAALNDATRVSDAALDRLGAAADGIDARGSASGYAARPAGDEPNGAGLWTTAYSAFGTTEGGDGTSAADGRVGAVVVGLDGLLGNWRVGVMGDAGTSSTEVSALASSVSSTDYGVGIYGGTSWGDTQVRLAAAYTRHDNSSTRSVDYPGFTDELSAEYASNTAQVAGEISHDFAFGAVGFTPFAKAAYVSHSTDGFSETGGAAALTNVGDVATATIATLGARVDYQMMVGDGMLLTASASLGWRHATGSDLAVDLALDGGVPISIVGTSMGDVTAIGAGLSLDVSDSTAFDLSYAGQLGSNAQTHAISGTWATKF